MLENLAVAGIIVAIFWIVIMGLYWVLSRRQPDVAAQMKALDEQLDRAEREAGRP